MNQNTPILIARDHIRIVEILEQRCEYLLEQFMELQMYHVDQVAEDWPEMLPEYMALTDLFSDCVSYSAKYAQTHITNNGEL